MEKYPEIKNCEFCPRDPNAKVIYTRRYKIKTPSSVSAINTNVVRKPRKRHLYRISIEKWRPTGGIIYCPKCGCNERPLIETRTERFTENQWCACCLLNCWPLCFLPWILPGHEVEHLHCSRCKAFLGVYNRHSNCLKPNRDFIITGHNKNVKLKSFPLNQEENKINSYKRHRAETVGDHVKTDPNRLPTIVIDGKPLHPDMVARLQRFRKFGSLAGIDLEAISEATQKTTNQINCNDDSLRDGVDHKPPSTAGNK